MQHDIDIHRLSLAAPPVELSPGPAYASASREWQGIPGIERAPDGTLFATWYSGGKGEGPDNYVLVVRSTDDGATWSEPILTIDPPGKVRAFDPVLWLDPSERLWLFWAQSYTWFNGRAGVWAIRCDAPGPGTLAWTPPRRLCNGIAMNKPVVLSNGEWHLPAALWDRDPRLPELEQERRANAVVSADEGRTWTLRGGAIVPFRTCDEHMVVERRDGSLWMLVRTGYGIGESVSADGGATWSPGRATALDGPNSRFYIRRLRSGRLLLINHVGFSGRSHMTALLSEDDGATWIGGLLLDERANVSYPDATETSAGVVYAIYDRERYNDREILMAVFTEEDVLQGSPISPNCRLRQLVNRP